MKKRIFSGVQPSGNFHLGNYLGAISQWVEMQNETEPIFCVVDLHALTVPQDPKKLRQKILETAKIYLAAGVDPKKSIVFQQSAVQEHTELCWILNTLSRMSDLFRMTQFKDKAELSGEKINLEEINKVGVGLFDYPVLMAADILLYNTEIVPVGKDQIQHIELARDLAKRFNAKFGETFKIPEAKTSKIGAVIMGLDNPKKKMSKSAPSEYNRIGMLDKPALAVKKIMRATTDAGTEIKFDEKNKPGLSNLLTIYHLLSTKEIKTIEKNYTGKGYGEFKKDLAEIVKNFLLDFQARYARLSDSEAQQILDEGAKRARSLAQRKMEEVKRVMGVA